MIKEKTGVKRMNPFSEFLYARRKSLGLTQQNIADCLNVTNKAVFQSEIPIGSIRQK